jgi:hypothetical protein
MMRKFVLTENAEKEIFGQVFVYEADADWLAEIDSFPGWHQYNGYFSILDLDGTVLAENKIMNGTSVDTESKNGRTSGTICITTTWEVCTYVKGQPGNSCYYETETNCTTISGGGTQIGGIPAEPTPLIPDEEDDPTPSPATPTSCAKEYIIDANGNCVQGCPSGQEIVNGNCEPVCPSGQRRDQNGHCTLIENCDTEDEIVNAIQNFLQDIWANTNVTSENTPMSDRLEDGGWVTERNGNYSYTPFPSDWERMPCGINPPADWQSDIPSNAVGWVHSHPFFLGEDRRSICGGDESSEGTYQGGPSTYDYRFLNAMQNATGNFSLKAYVIDGDLISSVNFLRQLEKYIRCGY